MTNIDLLRQASLLGETRFQAKNTILWRRVDHQQEGFEVDERRAGLFSFKLRRDIRADNCVTADRIKEVLCEHYGRARGESLFSRHIGSRGKDISSRKLRALLADGDRQLETFGRRIINPAIQDRIKDLITASVAQVNASIGTTDSDGVRRLHTSHRLAIETLKGTLSRGCEILSREPLNQPEISQSLAEVNHEIEKIGLRLWHLQDWIGINDAPGNFYNMEHDVLSQLREQFQNQKSLLENRLASCPTTNANVGHAIGLMFDAASRVVIDLADRATDPVSREKLARLAESLGNQKEAEAARHAGLPATDKAGNERIEALGSTPAKLSRQISRVVSGMRFQEGDLSRALSRTYSTKELGKMVSRAHCEELNAQHWDTVSRTVGVLTSTGPGKFVSDLRPATAINPTLTRLYDGHGVCCHSTAEPRHAVNLVCSELKSAASPDQQAQALFKAFRHGVHCAYGIGDPAARAAANNARVDELLVAALCDKPELLAQAIANKDNPAAPPVPLPITSVSLLTPDGWRKGSDNNETLYLREQTEAWQQASQGPRQIRIQVGEEEHTLTVQPQVLTFNFGVNAGAQGKLQGLAGGWKISTPMNTTALNALIGSTDPAEPEPAEGPVAEFLSGSADAQKKDAVRELTRQIKQLWHAETYRKSGKNPYLLPARILVLADMIGQTPAFNCKSGKDRTGQLDVEAKTLAARIHMLGEVPPLTDSESEDYRITREQMSIDGGNHEIQRMNTGLAGFKTKGVSGLDAVYRGTAMQAALGLSDHVHS